MREEERKTGNYKDNYWYGEQEVEHNVVRNQRPCSSQFSGRNLWLPYVPLSNKSNDDGGGFDLST